jgi:tetratricopeptide (TPR) repeat protein
MILCAALMTSCGKSTAHIEAAEDLAPFMEQAKVRERANDVDGAMEVYLRGLENDPSLAKAHLQLGLLYDQYKKDYLRAVFHYETYLEMRPDAEKRASIEELIKQARLYYATSLPDQPSEAIRELARLQEQISVLEQDLAGAGDRIEILLAERAKLVRALKALRSPEQNSAPPTALEDEAAGLSGPRPPEKYVVQASDSLSKIAGKVYNDKRKWRLIYEANRPPLRRPDDLRVGQALKIPPPE